MAVIVTRRFDDDGTPNLMAFDNADSYEVDELSMLLTVISGDDAVATFREWSDVAVVDAEQARALLTVVSAEGA